jgi:hypothetical protein
VANANVVSVRRALAVPALGSGEIPSQRTALHPRAPRVHIKPGMSQDSEQTIEVWNFSGCEQEADAFVEAMQLCGDLTCSRLILLPHFSHKAVRNTVGSFAMPDGYVMIGNADETLAASILPDMLLWGTSAWAIQDTGFLRDKNYASALSVALNRPSNKQYDLVLDKNRAQNGGVLLPEHSLARVQISKKTKSLDTSDAVAEQCDRQMGFAVAGKSKGSDDNSKGSAGSSSNKSEKTRSTGGDETYMLFIQTGLLHACEQLKAWCTAEQMSVRKMLNSELYKRFEAESANVHQQAAAICDERLGLNLVKSVNENFVHQLKPEFTSCYYSIVMHGNTFVLYNNVVPEARNAVVDLGPFSGYMLFTGNPVNAEEDYIPGSLVNTRDPNKDFARTLIDAKGGYAWNSYRYLKFNSNLFYRYGGAKPLGETYLKERFTGVGVIFYEHTGGVVADMDPDNGYLLDELLMAMSKSNTSTVPLRINSCWPVVAMKVFVDNARKETNEQKMLLFSDIMLDQRGKEFISFNASWVAENLAKFKAK